MLKSWWNICHRIKIHCYKNKHSACFIISLAAGKHFPLAILYPHQNCSLTKFEIKNRLLALKKATPIGEAYSLWYKCNFRISFLKDIRLLNGLIFCWLKNVIFIFIEKVRRKHNSLCFISEFYTWSCFYKAIKLKYMKLTTPNQTIRWLIIKYILPSTL